MQDLFRDSDKFINVTLLCKLGNKNFGDWFRLDKTKKFIKCCEEYLKKQPGSLIQIQRGGNIKTQGSWGHPYIVNNLAQWISCEFSIKVCIWIDEWKKNYNNKIEYNEALLNIKGDEIIVSEEKRIRDILWNELGGDIEVYTEGGFIDLLTDTEIIEVKNIKNWKHAIGQILVYSIYYPKHKKRIHLFDATEEHYDIIEKHCKIHNIIVTYFTNK
jgi:hypothetical protein